MLGVITHFEKNVHLKQTHIKKNVVNQMSPNLVQTIKDALYI